MITALVIVLLSFIGMIAILWSKSVQLSGGQAMFSLSTPERDARLSWWFERTMYQITHVSYKSLKNTLHNLLVAFENFFLAIFVKLGKKFGRIGDMVRGKDIPKNRGSVSFFLKNVEDVKEIR